MEDTVAAVSTPRGKGGVALLRVSGSEAIAVASAVFLPKNGKPLSEAESRRALYGQIRSADGEVIDDGLATVFRAPASFTGEDTVEICCHGGILLTENGTDRAVCGGRSPCGRGGVHQARVSERQDGSFRRRGAGKSSGGADAQSADSRARGNGRQDGRAKPRDL